MKELIEKLEILKDKLISSEDFEFFGQFEIIQEAIQTIQQKEETNAEELKRHSIGFTQTPVEWLEVKMKEYAIDLDLLSYVEEAKEMERKINNNDFSKWLYDNRVNFDNYPAYIKYNELYNEYLNTLNNPDKV